MINIYLQKNAYKQMPRGMSQVVYQKISYICKIISCEIKMQMFSRTSLSGYNNMICTKSNIKTKINFIRWEEIFK